MLCGVTATLGSNPSATATAARPHWGRAVLLCLPDLWARSLGVPVGGGPPARSPHASLTARSGRSRGPPWPCRHPPAPRPCPTTAHGHRSQALQFPPAPPHQWGGLAVRRFDASSRSPTAPAIHTIRHQWPTEHSQTAETGHVPLTKGLLVSPNHPPPANVSSVSSTGRGNPVLALPVSQQDASSDLSERNIAPALHENVPTRAT